MKLVPPSIVSEVSTTPTRSGVGGKGQARPAGCEAKLAPPPGPGSPGGQLSATNPGVRACRAAGPAAPRRPPSWAWLPLTWASSGRPLWSGAWTERRDPRRAYRPVPGRVAGPAPRSRAGADVVAVILSAPATATAGEHRNAASRRWDGHPSSRRHCQHLLDRPAVAAPAQQGLDPDPRPLRPLDKGERLPVPREHVNAAVRHRGRRSVVAGRPGMRQIPGPVEPSPLGVLAQGQVGLSFQPAPELLVGIWPLVACGVPPRASLVGHVGTSSTSTPGTRSGGPRGRSAIVVPAQDAVQVGLARPHRGGQPADPGGGCPPVRPGRYS